MSENAAPPDSMPVEHQPTDESRARVRQLAKVKTSKTSIAKEMGIGPTAFARHYTEDWEQGRGEAESAVLAKLLAQGLAGNANAGFKYLTLMGMVAPKRVEVTGKDGGPVEHVDLSRLTAEQLEQYGRLAATAAGVDPDSILFESTARAS